ncbi:hypothetical protein [Anaerocolumna jejuensis]|uniref:hypothetical protein n=1 Tax=Anaerocolumna jejuensis TaxID=259063 RepID=UPI003F7B8AD3
MKLLRQSHETKYMDARRTRGVVWASLFENLYSTKAAKNAAGSQNNAKLAALKQWLCFS